MNRGHLANIPSSRYLRTLLGLALLTLYTAAAQAMVGVEPAGVILQASPGGQVSQQVKLDNPSDKPLKLRAYLSDWDYSPAGQMQYHPVGTLPESAAPWITFSPATLDLPARASATVRYTVQVPQNATPGTYWAVFFFESETPPGEPGKTLATFKVRVGHVVYVNVPPLKEAGKISGIFGAMATDTPNVYEFAVQYANSGNQAYAVRGRVEVRNIRGDTVVTIPIRKTVALPRATRLITARLTGPLPAGEYTALVVLNYGDATLDLAGEYTFTLDKALGSSMQSGKGGNP